jgi:hypothetical protein
MTFSKTTARSLAVDLPDVQSDPVYGVLFEDNKFAGEALGHTVIFKRTVPAAPSS